MAEYLSPGVYVEEFESGPRPMSGVSTSIPGFLGLAQRGPVTGPPALITSVSDFSRQFGGYLDDSYGNYRFLRYAVEGFFSNGGASCYVQRVDDRSLGGTAAAREVVIKRGEDDDAPVVLYFRAKGVGEWGNEVQITFRAGSVIQPQTEGALSDDMKNIATVEVRMNELVEHYENVFLDERDTGSIFAAMSASNLVEVTPGGIVEEQAQEAAKAVELKRINIASGEASAAKAKTVAGDGAKTFTLPQNTKKDMKSIAEFTLENGEDGKVDADTNLVAEYKGIDTSGVRTGLNAFKDNSVISLLLAPGVTDTAIQAALVEHCETLRSRFAILDMPRDKKEIADLQAHRETVVSDFAAMYHPWLVGFDPVTRGSINLPPSGAVAGIFARTDNTRGVHKAPANEPVRGITGLTVSYNAVEQGHLNPRGINLIRSFPGQGILVWGARTTSSNSLWRYINVRRLFIFIEESIRANTNWVVFEPNSEMLWLRVERTIDTFLTDVWRNGALMGTTAQEAFFIRIGRDTMSQSDIDNGRLICEIGVAPVKPAEFIIFRLTQQTLTG